MEIIKKILDTVVENANYFLNNNLELEELKSRKLQVTLNNIAEKLGVKSINSIDAFDNSNIMGVDAVSVKVNFTNGKKIRIIIENLNKRNCWN